MTNVVEKAIKIAGSPAKLTKQINDLGYKDLCRTVVYDWLKQGFIGLKWLVAVHKATGICLTELNSEVYPPEIFAQKWDE